MVAMLVCAPVGVAAQGVARYCGDNLVLLIRGSGEAPQGSQPPGLTYQQVGEDIFGTHFADNPVGGGVLGVNVADELGVGDARVASLVYPATRVDFYGDPRRAVRGFDQSIGAGAQQFARVLERVYASCGQEDAPRLVVVGYSQGADVVNRAISDAVAAGNTSYVDKVTKFVFLADPSRRFYGQENANALSQMVPVSVEGGISRVITAAVGYPLVRPPLDVYRTANAERFASYCAPSDTVCDTHIAQSRPGIDLHKSYPWMVARCSATGGEYAPYMSCFYADVRRALGLVDTVQPARFVQLSDGRLFVSVSRALREELKDQVVTVRAFAFSGEWFRAESTLRRGSSGVVSVEIPSRFDVPTLDIVVEVDGVRVAEFPASFAHVAPHPDRPPALYVSAADEDAARVGPPLGQRVQDWDVALEERLGLVRQLYGPVAEKIMRLWYSVAHHVGLYQDYRKVLQDLADRGVIWGGGSSGVLSSGSSEEHKRWVFQLLTTAARVI